MIILVKVVVFILASIIAVTNAAPRYGSEIYITIDENCTDFTMELHLPTYHFCGPGTRICERLKNNDTPINGLDEACRKHDLSYDWNSEMIIIRQADELLAKMAWRRLFARDASFFERIAALTVGIFMEFILLLPYP